MCTTSPIGLIEASICSNKAGTKQAEHTTDPCHVLAGTQQVKLFRDSYTELASTGFSIYGLSNDSPKSNTSFKEQQKLSYELLCDPERTLINAIGLKSSAGKTQRGVFVVDKQGKVLAAEPGGPAATVEVVRRLVGEEGADKADTKAA